MPVKSFRLPLDEKSRLAIGQNFLAELDALGDWAPEEAERFLLQFDNGRMALEWIGENFRPFDLNWEKSWNYHRDYFKGRSIFGELLIKALGIKQSTAHQTKILDATLGPGEDALLMLLANAQVWGCERHPLLRAMHVNQLRHLEGELKSLVEQQFHFCPTSSQEFQGEVDVVYFDPMYSHVNSKAKPKKEMQFMRLLVGEDQDSEVLAKQWKARGVRLVIKRPLQAPPLLEAPSIQYKGKSTRYDVYL